MKRFCFTLQAVLTLRQREERESLEGYATALKRRQEACDALAEVNRVVESIRHLRLQSGDGITSARALHQMQVRTDLAILKKNEANRSLVASEVELERRLAEVLAARQRREAVERCRDLQMQEFVRLEAQEESRLLDEFTARKPNSQISSIYG